MKLTAIAFAATLLMPTQQRAPDAPCLGDCRLVSRAMVQQLVDRAHSAGLAEGRSDCLRPVWRSL